MNFTEHAQQIIELVNTHSPLVRKIGLAEVVKNLDNYHVVAGDGLILACVKLTKVSWYQVEISHLVAHPDYRRQGHGRLAVRKALDKALTDGARLAQCTIRCGNEASERLFRHVGFQPAAIFTGPSGHRLQVWQRVLS